MPSSPHCEPSVEGIRFILDILLLTLLLPCVEGRLLLKKNYKFICFYAWFADIYIFATIIVIITIFKNQIE